MKRISLYYMSTLIFVSVCVGGCSHLKTTSPSDTKLPSEADTALVYGDVELYTNLYAAWEQEYKCMEADKKQDVTQMKQYQQLRNMGKKIIPMLIVQLSDKTQAFALPLYDELQDVDSLKSFDFSKGEVIRAQETVKKYVEATLGRKKYEFSSDSEKIDSIRALFRRHNWCEDTTVTKEERDSIILNMDYEITEDFLRLGSEEE